MPEHMYRTASSQSLRRTMQPSVKQPLHWQKPLNYIFITENKPIKLIVS